ncbi:MAG: tyrosine-type recombinase/integrase [Betaproteobacteria bacterium]|nr:tyrosine-type recombinase/integrase [Betaproteobacteria bacterium]
MRSAISMKPSKFGMYFGLVKPATPQILRHSLTMFLLDSGYNIQIVQELLGHTDVSTVIIYTIHKKIG